MAVTAQMFGQGILGQYSSTAARRIDWDADTVKVTLHTSAWTIDVDNHDFANDASNEVAQAGNYTTGGISMTTAAVALDSASDQVRLDGSDVQWTSASFSAAKAAVWKNTGTSTTDPLLSYVDFGGTETVSSGTFTIQWDTTGVMVIDYT